MILQFRFSRDRVIIANVTAEYYRVHGEHAINLPYVISFLANQGYRCKVVTIRIDSIIDGNLVPATDTGLDIDDEDAVAFLIKYG